MSHAIAERQFTRRKRPLQQETKTAPPSTLHEQKHTEDSKQTTADKTAIETMPRQHFHTVD